MSEGDAAELLMTRLYVLLAEAEDEPDNVLGIGTVAALATGLAEVSK